MSISISIIVPKRLKAKVYASDEANMSRLVCPLPDPLRALLRRYAVRRADCITDHGARDIANRGPVRGEACHGAVPRQHLSPTDQLGLLRTQWRAGASTGNPLPLCQ